MMSENTTPKAEEATQATTEETTSADFHPITSQEDFDKVTAGIRHKAEAKLKDYEALKDKAAKYDEMEEQSKSELTKLAERAEKAEKEAADLAKKQEYRDAVAKVSEEAKVAESVVRNLRGETYEELKVSAEALKTSYSAPPTNGEGGEKQPPTLSRSEILAIEDDKERKAAIAANIDLFT